MTKKFWTTGITKHPDRGRGPLSRSVDLDVPDTELVYDRQDLRHMFGSANSTEVIAPDWTAFTGIAVALGVPHIIRVEQQMFTLEMMPQVRPDAYAVTGGHCYLGFGELEDYCVAAKLLLTAREETN